MSDVDLLRKALADVEKRAGDLPWANERRWRARTHVRTEAGAPCVDLHDLSVRLGLAAVEVVLERAEHLDAATVKIVTGQGKHSPNGQSDLRHAVLQLLGAEVGKRGMRVRPSGAGAFLLLVDPSRASRPPTSLIAVLALILAAVAAALWRALVGG